MYFLADESCDFAVVRALRNLGYDVTAVSEFAAGSTDEMVLQLAVNQNRILITEDKDFGQLVYAGARDISGSGVILIRFLQKDRPLLVNAMQILVAENSTKLAGSFVVLRPNKMRIARLF